MHVAATNPVCVSREEIDPEIIKKEREIAEGQAEGKPPAAIEKIVEGKINKFLSESCYLNKPMLKTQIKQFNKS